MIKTNKILKFFITLIIFCIIINIMPCASKAFEYKKWKAMKEGDVIYFDNTDLNWENVYIYIWNSNTKSPYKSWDQADTMTKVSDNIYSYTITSDMASGSYDMLIFKNGKDGNQNQTIDLGFIEAGFVYKIDNYQGDKRVGYWYLYDNTEILEHLENAKLFQQDKKYYTEESYGELDSLILQAINEAKGKFILYSDDENQSFYLKIEALLDEIDELTDNLVVDTTILKDEISSKEENIENLDDYTEESVKDLQDALDKAKELLEKDDITVDELKKELEAIEKADENLQLKPKEDEEETGKVTPGQSTDDTNTDGKENNTGSTNETEGTNPENTNGTNAPSASDTSNSSNISSNSNGSNVSNNLNSSNSSDTPKTGDNIVLDVVGLVLGVAGILVTIVIRKNKLFNRK